MSKENRPYKKWIKENENKWISAGVMVGAFAITMPFIVYFSSGSSLTAASFSKLATVGDFLGGTTAGFLSLASILFLISTIVMQRKELGMQREELQLTRNELVKANEQYAITNETMLKQQFENTFFNMINMHSNLINDLKTAESNGRNVITDFFNEVNTIFKVKGYRSFLLDHLRKYDDLEDWYKYYSAYVNLINQLKKHSGSRSILLAPISQIKELRDSINKGHLKDDFGRYNIEQMYLFTFDQIEEFNRFNTSHNFSQLFRDELIDGVNQYKKESFVYANELLNFPLSNYIKSVRTVIRFLDDTNFDDTTKNKYLNIFFSQFTIHEITVIRYFINLGDEYELKSYFKKYSSLSTKDILQESII